MVIIPVSVSSSSLHHLFDDLFEVLVVGVVSGRSQDGVAVHLKRIRNCQSCTFITQTADEVLSTVTVTFMRREMFLKRAREPYEPNMSAAMMTPPVNFTPSTDVPVTIGFLQGDGEESRLLSAVIL